MPIGPGTRLGQYVVQDYIGEGAMGVVYRAYHPQLERVGAVKVLHALGPNADSTARFRREAQAIAHMRHPNIVNVFDFGEYEGTPYMIVEYVEGGNLSDRLRSGRLDGARAIRYLRGIGDAIDYAHSRGIVHRDIKPANVLMTNSDTPILADFGLVKLMQSASVKSMTGVTTGTPAYMAPEQVTGTQVGPPSDRYSFAVVAYQMLTGSIPFDEGGVLEVMYAQVHRVPAAPSSRNPELDARVDAVLLRGMAKDPKVRWESCAAMVAALDTALNTPRVKAPPQATVVMAPPLPGAAPAFAAAYAPPAAPSMPGSSIAPPPPDLPELTYVPGRPGVIRTQKPKKKKKSRHLLRWLGVLLLILLLLGTGLVLLASALKPALGITPNPAQPGEHVIVSATRLPHGQAGEIRMFSFSRAFVADSNGDVTVGADIPSELRAGDYVVSIWWNGSNHAQTTLHVTAPVAVITSPVPSPIASPTPGVSPHGTPSSSATPRATPKPTPRASPTPSSSPAPPPPSVTLVSISKLGGAKLTFHNFPGGAVTIWVSQNGSQYQAGSVTVPPSTVSWTTTVSTPLGVLVSVPPLVGKATVSVCPAPCYNAGTLSVAA